MDGNINVSSPLLLEQLLSTLTLDSTDSSRPTKKLKLEGEEMIKNRIREFQNKHIKSQDIRTIDFLREERAILEMAYDLNHCEKSWAEYFATQLHRPVHQIEKWFQDEKEKRETQQQQISQFIMSRPPIDRIPDLSIRMDDNSLEEDLFEQAKRVHDIQKRNSPFSMEHMRVSLIFTLYNNHFTIDYISNSERQKKDQKQTCVYNRITKSFLKDVASGIFSPILVESLENMPVNYYHGGILVELVDRRHEMSLSDLFRVEDSPPYPSKQTVRLFLEPDTATTLESIRSFVEEKHFDLTEEQKSFVIQKILHSVHKPVCLEPYPIIGQLTNALHYNQHKHNFRRVVRRTVSRTLMPNNPASTGMTIQSSMMRARKNDHSLLNHIVTSGWSRKDLSSYLGTEKREYSTTTPEIPNAKNNSSNKPFSSPLDYMRITSSHTVNNKRPQCRTISFAVLAESNRPDAQKKLKVTIFPTDSRYDCVVQTQLDKTKWIIGSRYASELYASRLRDMLLSMGRTKLMQDQEMDFEEYKKQQERARREQAAARGASLQQQPQQPQQLQQPQQQMRQITPGQMRFQNGQVQQTPGGGMPNVNQAAGSSNQQILNQGKFTPLNRPGL